MSKKDISRNSMDYLREEPDALTLQSKSIQGVDITRRKFIQYSTTLLAGVSLPFPLVGCVSKDNQWSNYDLPKYEIDTVVQTTEERMISFNMNLADVPPKNMKMPPVAPDGKSDGAGSERTV